MTARELILQLKDLPPVSPTALKLAGLLNRATQHNEDIIEVLRYDSALTARLLRACNSSWLALHEPVASVDQAVLLLGHQEIIRFVLALGCGGALRKPLPGYAVEQGELWRHSLAAALAAERIAAAAGHFEPAVAFTAGLLHDIGKLVLHQALTPEAQAAIRKRIEEGTDARVEAEKGVLGTDHAEVGASLLRHWRLPDAIVEGVAHHHDPAITPTLGLSAVVHVANCLSHLLGEAPGWDAFAIRAQEPVVEALGLSAEGIEQIVISIHESLQLTDQSLAIA